MAPAITKGFSPDHPANDYGLSCGSPLGAPFDGTIIATVPSPVSYGNHLWIRSSANRKIAALVAHMESFAVAPGQRVIASEYIGDSGNTGHVCGEKCYVSNAPKGVGCHVHFGIMRGGIVTPSGVVGGTWIQPGSFVGSLFSPRDSAEGITGRFGQWAGLLTLAPGAAVSGALAQKSVGLWRGWFFLIAQWLKIAAGGLGMIVGLLMMLVLIGWARAEAVAAGPLGRSTRTVVRIAQRRAGGEEEGDEAA